MHSNKYKNWIAILDLKTCLECRMRHGQIYLAEEIVDPEPPLHPNCRCEIEWVKALYAGTATSKGNDGADWWLKWIGKLPDYYITSTDAKNQGYNPYLGNLWMVAPGKMLTKGKYKNKNGHLPSAPGRIWYEADINYTWGYRGSDRVLFSNDGLVFVTYDHYKTFQVIV
ncbi:MAG: phage head morphogenesis protein [Clostridia bacterium]|nr:phage head morphogenesis protein [Clostridia bacterium]